MIIYT
ncbi:157e6728-e732-478e-9649-9336a7069b9d [Thermothielavioides terrestris]